MPVTSDKHQIAAYTIEASGTPIATIKAASIPDAAKFILDFEDLVGNGWWDGEEPLAIRAANWLEKDALLSEVKRREEDGDDYPPIFWHSRETTSIEDNARKQAA